jgi:hypothetical protein
LSEPDYSGHTYGWGTATWKQAVQHVDLQLGRILEAIHSRPEYSNQFAIVLTADHGGGGNSSTGHGTYTAPKNYTIPLFVWGPGIRAGGDLYSLFLNRGDPGTNRLSYVAPVQPLRNGDSGNIALALLGLPAIPGSFMLPEMGDRPVMLTVSNVAGGTVLSWPVSAEGYYLESSSALAIPTVWQGVDGVVTNGNWKTYAVPMESSPQFFRLRRD